MQDGYTHKEKERTPPKSGSAKKHLAASDRVETTPRSHFGSSHFGSSHFGSRRFRLAQAQVGSAAVVAMSRAWLLLATLHAVLGYKQRWRWRFDDQISFLQGNDMHLIPTPCSLASIWACSSRSVFRHSKTLAHAVAPSPLPLVRFVWVLGFLVCLVFLVALPVSVSSWFFLLLVLGGGSLACWFGFRSCAHPAVRRSCGLCRWVGRRRVSCPRFGWKGRMRSRVSPRSRVSFRPASASPVHRPVPLNCLCRGGGGETAKNRLC